MIGAFTGIFFTTLAVIFVVIVLYDYLREHRQLTPRRKTWLLTAIIFCAVGIFLFFMHTFRL